MGTYLNPGNKGFRKILMIADAVYRELIESCPELEGKSLTDAMIACVEN